MSGDVSIERGKGEGGRGKGERGEGEGEKEGKLTGSGSSEPGTVRFRLRAPSSEFRVSWCLWEQP